MKPTDGSVNTNKLIAALMDPSIYPHEVEAISLIETHISWVILTGRFAYKIKKPVSLGFLDFSTLAKRKHYCEEELRLNRRLAPQLYLQVVAIRGTPECPHFNGDGEVLEYAVKMVQFPQQAQLDQMLARGELQPGHMDALAVMVADFHQRVAVADNSSHYGQPGQVLQSVMDTIARLRQYLDVPEGRQAIDELASWCRSNFSLWHGLFEQRKHEAYIRECHGDMHLRNLAWFENQPLAFDCIEFSPELRWNDVISEVAFLVMDLDARGKPQLAQRFLNAYLERSGDYSGVRLLRFYLVYRAMVRAMVDAIRITQSELGADARQQAEEEALSYLDLAQSYTHYPQACLLICHGLSGSGKTTYSQLLLERFAAIRIRSDVERKRLYAVRPGQKGDDNIYSSMATERTYEHLGKLSTDLLQAGYSVIVDATFQQREQRLRFQQLAQVGGWPYVILDFTASEASLRQRIAARRGDASDADLQVLEQQLQQGQPLQEDEQTYAIHIDSEREFDVDRLLQQIRQHI